MSCRILPIIALAACGSLQPAQVNPVVVTVPDSHPATPTGAPAEDPNFQTPPDWNPVHEAWMVDLRTAQVPGFPNTLWSEVKRELAVSVVREDAPRIEVRAGAIVADSVPAEQDWCVPVSGKLGGTLDPDGHYEIQVSGENVELGQPWMFDALWLTGHREDAISGPTMELAAMLPAASVANIAWNTYDDGCDRFATIGLACTPCLDPELHGETQCVKVELLGATVILADQFDLEPITAGDIAANPGCD